MPLSEQTFPSFDQPFPSPGSLTKGALLEINQGSLLIDSETFIADSKEQVKNSAQTGPVLDTDAASYTITKTTNRRQIDKEEKENKNKNHVNSSHFKFETRHKVLMIIFKNS